MHYNFYIECLGLTPIFPTHFLLFFFLFLPIYSPICTKERGDKFASAKPLATFKDSPVWLQVHPASFSELKLSPPLILLI